MNIRQALLELAPGAQWTLNGDEYSDLVWNSEDITKPTEAAITAKIAELSDAQPMEDLRRERNRLIAKSDWMANSDVTMSDEWRTYRQALRDLPSTATPVLDNTSKPGISGVTWPTKPS